MNIGVSHTTRVRRDWADRRLALLASAALLLSISTTSFAQEQTTSSPTPLLRAINSTEASVTAAQPAETNSITEAPPEDIGPAQAEGFAQSENTPEAPLEDGGSNDVIADDSAPGIRLGTLTLRPSVYQGIQSQRRGDQVSTESRTYLSTTVRGTLESDWSRHALRVSGEGQLERNIAGKTIAEKPRAMIDADLRLDLGNDIEAHILAGYDFQSEDVTSPNALSGVQSQGREHRFNLGTTVQKQFGPLRTLGGVSLERAVYTDAKDTNGAAISLKDRDRSSGTVRARVGYELSPALIPFLELSAGATRYDQKVDQGGYERSSETLAAKVGVEFDRGEKLSGEFALGYMRRDFADRRFRTLDAFSVDATANWSPQRGTDVHVSLRTAFDDFASGDKGGWTSYKLETGLTHQLRRDLVARLTSQIEYRDADNVTDYINTVGLTYAINRYVDFTADASYRFTPRYQSNDIIVSAGIRLKR